MNLKRDKKGLSSIVTTLIIVVLSLVAIGVVWGVVSNLLKSGEKQTNFQFGTLFLNLKIEKVLIDSSGNVSVSVSRGTGEGDLAGIDFIFSDGINSKVIEKTSVLGELGSQMFVFNASELTGISSVTGIEIAPLMGSKGNEQLGSKVDEKKSIPYSCANILAIGNSIGDGIYTIDPDGLGNEQSIQVYCDMTTDGGGWTLVQSTVKGQAADAQWNNSFSTQLTQTIGSPSLTQPYRLSMKYWYIIKHTQWAKMALTTAEQKKTFDKSSNFVLRGVDNPTSPTKFTFTGSDNVGALNGLTSSNVSWNSCTNGVSYFNTACCGTCILYNSPTTYNSYNQPMMSTITAIDGSTLQKWNTHSPLDRLNIFLR